MMDSTFSNKEFLNYGMYIVFFLGIVLLHT